MEVKKYEVISGKNTFIHEFGSISEYYNHICKAPLNEVFRWQQLASSDGDYSFRKTHNFEEATQLLKNGWDDMAKKLEQKVKVATQFMPKTVQKQTYDVCGYQASVPRYLQGVPQSMINKKPTKQKQKVVTLNKDISYSAMFSTDKIIENSAKALEIVKKIEAQGTRVNLNLIWGNGEGSERFIVKIRIKSANERLNISKLAFPLVHPSMLRRLLFRYVETSPVVTSPDWKFGYGSPLKDNDLKQKGEIYLPKTIDNVESVIKNLS